jgi:hypothetical protein
MCTVFKTSSWFFLSREMYRTKVVEKIKTHFKFFFFRKVVPFLKNVEKYGTDRQATFSNIIRRMRWACWFNKAKIQTHSY